MVTLYVPRTKFFIIVRNGLGVLLRAFDFNVADFDSLLLVFSQLAVFEFLKLLFTFCLEWGKEWNSICCFACVKPPLKCASEWLVSLVLVVGSFPWLGSLFSTLVATHSSAIIKWSLSTCLPFPPDCCVW